MTFNPEDSLMPRGDKTKYTDKQKRKAYWRGRNDAKGKAKIVPIDRTPNKQEPADFAAEQLKVVSKAEFAQRPLLNRSEANVFTALDKAVIARNLLRDIELFLPLMMLGFGSGEDRVSGWTVLAGVTWSLIGSILGAAK